MRFLFFVSCIALLPSASFALPVESLSPELGTRQSGSSWFLPNLDHTTGAVRGFVPNLVNSAGQANFTYPVYKTVNSGDAQGFTNAISSDGPSGGARDNCWLAGQPRVIYLSPGKFSWHVFSESRHSDRATQGPIHSHQRYSWIRTQLSLVMLQIHPPSVQLLASTVTIFSWVVRETGHPIHAAAPVVKRISQL
jgi:hypothetical protein